MKIELTELPSFTSTEAKKKIFFSLPFKFNEESTVKKINSLKLIEIDFCQPILYIDLIQQNLFDFQLGKTADFMKERDKFKKNNNKFSNHFIEECT